MTQFRPGFQRPESLPFTFEAKVRDKSVCRQQVSHNERGLC